MTYDQHSASDPTISAWVSASAGTGKTKVLTDRVLRLLLAGSPPGKILCITYTKAASAEMEQRIDEQLGKWAICSPEELLTDLQELTGKAPDTKTLKRARQLFARVLDAPDRIRIQTIHAFCQSVLKRFPLEAGVAPHFTLIDEQTSAELLHEAKMKLFSESCKSEERSVAEAISALANMVSEQTINELIANIIEDRKKFITWFESKDGFAKLCEAVYQKLGLHYGVSEKAIFTKYFNYTEAELISLRQTLVVLSQASGKSDQVTHDALRDWLESSQSSDKNAYIAAYLTKEGEPRKNICTVKTEKIREILLAEQSRVYNFFSEVKSLKIAVATCHVIKLAEALLTIYRRLKTSHGYLDYDDIILTTVNLLHKNPVSWVLYKLDGGIDHLLVDEAQDTNPEQWKLVDALTGEFFAGEGAKTKQRTVFVVGDGKQSIFSFQGAEPLEFERMQSLLRKRITSASEEFRNVNLELSFRSTEPVLQAIDEVFGRDAARDGLIFSEHVITHQAHRKGMAGRVEVWPLVEVEKQEELSAWHISDKAIYILKAEAICAKNIAETIAGWLRDKRKLLAENRLVTPGDIMILVQRRGYFSSALLRALKHKNIPVSGADRLILTEHIAAQDSIALAEFLLLPEDDLTLATVLKSPFIGLSEEELFELAYDRKDASLWQRLKAEPKFKAAHDFLSDLLAKTDYLPPYELFSYIFETRGGRKKLAARLGNEIDDPLNEFLNLTLQYTDIHPPSLQRFLEWLKSGVTNIKRDMEKARDEVRIMTVHAAKGLQSPIVFLPDTTRLPRSDNGILWSDLEENIPLWLPFSDMAEKHSRDLKEVLRLKTEREYRRLLYVAMTRAEDELYICGWKGDKAVSEKCWYELIKQASDTWQEEDGKKILISAQTAPSKTKSVTPQKNIKLSLPEWINRAAKDEPTPTKPLAPSRMETTGNVLSPLKNRHSRARGLLIHRLLQYLPDVDVKDRKSIMEKFITHFGNDFSASEQEQIGQEVLAILNHPEFAPIFGTDSIAEAPISGVVQDANGKVVTLAGQIDRIAIMQDTVYIIDYKTNVDASETESQIPGAYIKQMAAYRALIAQIYPDKTIKCGLLFTAIPKLMVLSDI